LTPRRPNRAIRPDLKAGERPATIQTHGASMPTPTTRACAGCGLRLPVTEAQPDPRYDASPECWQLYGELTASTVTRGDSEFIHQYLVDAYGAQHVVARPRPIGPAFALIGLYLSCERGHTGRQVQHLHVLLARRSKTWPAFTPPPPPVGALTILDVLNAPPGDERDATLRRWARAVWAAWQHEHDRVKTLFETVMAD
jgi:hypothetical protein